jgi:antitoxin (DNA-binding transcriptional repressor) of toxin-antitoxin stability system
VRFLSVRGLRNEPGKVWRDLAENDLVVTANGRPVAILVSVKEGDLEETLTALRRARASVAVSRMRRRIVERGVERLSAAEIDREIRAVRRRRTP